MSTPEPDARRHLSVRLLLAALGAQLLLFGGLLLVVLHGFGGIFHPGDDDPVQRTAAPVAPASPARPRPTGATFDPGRALRLVDVQVRYGQRPAGSPQLRSLAERVLRPRLPDAHLEALPGHPGLRNVVGVLPGRLPALVIGAHYDTESHPAGFVGANDSAAGTAAVLELARALTATKRPANARELRFVLFDGEEEPTEADNVDFYKYALRGSKAYASAHKSEVRALILLDYIANKGLQLPHEATSDPELWASMRAAAQTAGHGVTFPDAEQTGILDDHTPFLRAGIPAIDLIDFSYAYADGLQDTPDKLSRGAMDATGSSVLQLVDDLDRSGY